MTEPRIVDRAAQPYVFIRRRVPMSRLGELVEVHGQVFGWLAEHDVPPAGAPFWKYNVIDMARELEIEVGVPTATVPTGDGEVRGGILPSGRYATAGHTGHPDELMEVTSRFLRWAETEGLQFDRADASDGDHWTSRLEIYETDPAEEPDLAKWHHTLAFRLT
ncbi:GyrI-like domain-containing protein [Microlunatus speluncae]|uniref:GyrI-like domain-containing protein n=1 Tax=Microlunatus speluncae TaxID=2594267 RepID=UPI001FE799CF|nr:GyrI-like domain-containing protein [Microlunatus speluncae]